MNKNYKSQKFSVCISAITITDWHLDYWQLLPKVLTSEKRGKQVCRSICYR